MKDINLDDFYTYEEYKARYVFIQLAHCADAIIQYMKEKGLTQKEAEADPDFIKKVYIWWRGKTDERFRKYWEKRTASDG